MRGGCRPPLADIELRRRRQDRGAPPNARHLREKESRTSALLLGRGCGKGVMDARPPGSTKLARTASPPIPSARTWCSTSTSADLPSARPVTKAADHNGPVRGSGVRTTSRAVSRSACSSPGCRHLTPRTCRRTSNRSSSTQIGPPQPGATRTSRWRIRGMAWIRSASSCCTRPRSSRSAPARSLASSMRTTPNCSGTFPLSIARNARSAGLARSTAGWSNREVIPRHREVRVPRFMHPANGPRSWSVQSRRSLGARMTVAPGCCGRPPRSSPPRRRQQSARPVHAEPVTGSVMWT